MADKKLADEVLEKANEAKITKGMANTMKGNKECTGCGMKIPKYPGRYPKKCPECGMELAHSNNGKVNKAETK